MHNKLSKILVTGGAGFIGSAFVRLLVNRDCPRSTKGLSPQEAISKDTKGTVPELVVVDKLTYAGDLKRLQGLSPKGTAPDFKFYKADICDKKRIESILKKERPRIVIHFAAETHVDRSILNSTAFVQTNVIGTQVLLDLSRKYKIKKFIHISSDEIYGDIEKGKFREDSPLRPNSPYAASKAAADLLIKSYVRTYSFPAIIIRPCNNYGPWQYPEKLIPVVICKALNNNKVPVYAKGLNMREWLYVEDCVRGILIIMKDGRIGEIYNLGSGQEKKNIGVVKAILDILKKPQSLIQLVKDRPGHDWRYALSSSKVRNLGWSPKVSFAWGIEKTVVWNIVNRKWLMDKVAQV